jgi:hypothetical protein
MIDNFSQILRWLLITIETPSTKSHFGDVTPFKIQFKFDIPIFEGHIEIDSLKKWLSMLEGYLSVQNFSNSEKIIFRFLRPFPISKIHGIFTVRNMLRISL